MTESTIIYQHKVFGDVVLRRRAVARNITARWIGPQLHVSIPPHLTRAELENFFDTLGPRIAARRPSSSALDFDTTVGGHYADFTFREDPNLSSGSYRIRCNSSAAINGKLANYIIAVGPLRTNIKDSETLRHRLFNKLLQHAAVLATEAYILPRARELAAEVGRYPGGWYVKDSRRALGRCSSDGIITLSPRLIFLPEELSDFVIYHELAHLTEMNHSKAFHQLCDSYMGGREKRLAKELKNFKFPVF